MSDAPVNLDQIEAVLRLIDREVWILTAADGERRGGLLATWVSAASIDRERPVLLAGIAPNHFTAELVHKSKAFAAHLLRPDQIELAWNFARDSGHERDKLTGVGWSPGDTGSPILADCLAWCDCRCFARYDAGDRLFFWADVVAAGKLGPDPPLCEQAFFRGLTGEQKQQLIAARDADLTIQRPEYETWRRLQQW
jgi:flavin reductase (DIM6/NTAB) family NADH-FMN oxidoreductase RutF